MNNIQIFEDKKVRSHYDSENETWYFSVVDIVGILTDQPSVERSRNYWKVLKSRLLKEGNESVTNCNQLKLPSEDGKFYKTDVGNVEQIFRLVQSIPSPKAEPFKQWLAKVGYERLQEIQDPSLSMDRARENWKKKGLKSQNLRDHMSEAELLFTALAELSTRQIAEADEAKGLQENANAGKQGGQIANNAKKELEAKTGKKVVTKDNFLPPSQQRKIKKK
jgi:hypothetical protein